MMPKRSFRARMPFLVTFWCFLLGILLSTSLAAASPQCSQLFTLDEVTVDQLYTDPRPELDKQGGLLLIGEGTSGKVFIFKTSTGEYKVAKLYKPERAESLERDHNGLKLVQKLFDLDAMHSMNFKVARSEIVENFNGVSGQRALIMPYVPGINLHKLLVSTKKHHPQHAQVEALYSKLIMELDRIAVQMKIRDEIRPETDRYFQDHIVDGLPMLIIEGQPRILIKTDNIIFNPADNSLTLIDPYYCPHLKKRFKK
ncbi:MAG: hypothetical protein IT287_03570 [Bdellovibrionaceae bacterium]|nr:hypothetical protein [Pseudobdellovibrionaceae bacterium]